MTGSDRMKLKRIYSVVAMLGVVMMALAIAGCGTKTVSVADVTYKDMPLQIHNDANVTALNKATVTPTLTGQVAYAVKVGDQELPGELTYVDVTQPENVPSVLVKATFNNDKGLIKAGEFYTLIIESDIKAKMLTVPSKAVRENQDGKYVYVLTENNTVDVRVVEVGMTEDDDVAIISGLNEGDKVITTDGNFELGESVKL